MVYYTVRSQVTDYRRWRDHFDASELARRAAGATGTQQVYRDLEDPNSVVTVIEWDSAENARRYLTNPMLKLELEQSGVVGESDICLLHQV